MDFLVDKVEFLPVFFGKILLALTLPGKAADDGQGIFDFVSDVGHHSAQSRQTLMADQFFLQALAFPQVPEIPDDADFPAVFVQEAGRQPDGHQRAVLMESPGLIIF